MKLFLTATFALLCILTHGQEVYNNPLPLDSLPKDIREFPVRAGMTPREVDEALKDFKQAIDTSKTPEATRMILRGPWTDNPWSGIYLVEFKNGAVSRVTFTQGNLNVAVGFWILSGN